MCAGTAISGEKHSLSRHHEIDDLVFAAESLPSEPEPPNARGKRLTPHHALIAHMLPQAGQLLRVVGFELIAREEAVTGGGGWRESSRYTPAVVLAAPAEART